MRLAFALARITLLEAVRNRLLWLAIAVVLIAVGLAGFVGKVALIEAAEIETALLAAAFRIAAVFILVTFVITSMVREANDKVNELVLSQAAPRAAYFFGRLAGFLAIAAMLALLFTLPLSIFAPPLRIAIWSGSLFCELLIVVSMSLFCVYSLTQILPAFSATIGFYVLSRSMAAIQAIASFEPGTPDWVDQAIGRIVDFIALLLPSLDQMTQTSWLLHSPPTVPAMATILFQAALYGTLICSAALFDLYRKNY